MKLFVNNNGSVLPADDYSIYAGNRGHLYGDGLFESIRVVHGKMVNLDAHIQRMLDGAIALKIRIPSFFTTAFFQERIQELLKKSEIEESARIRISLDRVAGGTYLPDSNDASFIIEVFPLEQEKFELNKKGFEVDLYTEIRKHKSKLSGFKTKNGLLYVLAAIAAKEKGLDDYLLTNPRGSILEGTNANIFIVSNGMLYTPSLEEGCLGGVMRMTIINLALENGIRVYECSLLPQNLLVADEILLTNAIKGVQWVGGYRTKRYQNTVAQKLTDLLNDSI